jgi:hypothetical protein
LVSNQQGPAVLDRVTAPQRTERVFSGQFNGVFSTEIVDGSRIWLGSWQRFGIFLYEDKAGVMKMSDIGAIPLGKLR